MELYCLNKIFLVFSMFMLLQCNSERLFEIENDHYKVTFNFYISEIRTRDLNGSEISYEIVNENIIYGIDYTSSNEFCINFMDEQWQFKQLELEEDNEIVIILETDIDSIGIEYGLVKFIPDYVDSYGNIEKVWEYHLIKCNSTSTLAMVMRGYYSDFNLFETINIINKCKPITFQLN